MNNHLANKTYLAVETPFAVVGLVARSLKLEDARG